MVQHSNQGQGARQWVGAERRLPGASGPHVDETVVVHIQGVPVLVEPVRGEVHRQGEYALCRGVPLESKWHEDAVTSTYPSPTWSLI